MLDLRDLSEVAVKVMTEKGHEYATYELCGPRVTITEMADIVGRARGVELNAVGIEPSKAPLPTRFAMELHASGSRAMWTEYDQCGFYGNSNVFRMLLGRPRQRLKTSYMP